MHALICVIVEAKMQMLSLLDKDRSGVLLGGRGTKELVKLEMLFFFKKCYSCVYSVSWAHGPGVISRSTRSAGRPCGCAHGLDRSRGNDSSVCALHYLVILAWEQTKTKRYNRAELLDFSWEGKACGIVWVS